MPFDVQLVTFNDEALDGLRREVADWRDAAEAGIRAAESLKTRLREAQAREEAERQRANRAASESSELGNALVHQKDALLELCLQGKYERVLDLLAFAEESWRAVGYGYKVDEIKQRVRENVKLNLEDLKPRQRRERAWLEGIRAKVG